MEIRRSAYSPRISFPESSRFEGAGNILKKVIWAVGLIVAFLFFWALFVVVVPAGHVGVLNTFGVVNDAELQPGLHLKLPWQGVAVFSTKTIELKEAADTPSDEGLTVTLETSILYRIESGKASDIYKTIGLEYEGIVIEPMFRSVVRGVTASYDAKSLYTSERTIIADRIQGELGPKLRDRGIVLENVLLRSISMPRSVQGGIEAKLVAEQEAQRMEFVLQKENREAERKVIEAEGIAKSQAIIDKSLTPQYLSWFWISNLGKYNAVIYVPIGQNGMPMFKDVDNIDEWGAQRGAFGANGTG